MSTFKQKNVIKSYKLRLQEKLKTVTEETENATSFLNNCVEEFSKRVQHILEIKDEKCLSLYRKLSQDLESFSEKLFILQASFEEATEDESDSSESQEASDKLLNTQPKTLSDVLSTNERFSSVPTNSENEIDVQPSQSVNLQKFVENVNLQIYAEENVPAQRHIQESVNDQKCLKRNTKYSSYDEDGESVTDDDFYSLNSGDNVQITNSCTFSSCLTYGFNNEPLSGNDCASSLASQNSCCSICSNSSESPAIYKDTKNNHFVETCIREIHDKSSLEPSNINLVIRPPNFEVLSHFSGTLSCIIDPGNFWIQLENAHGYKFNKSEHISLKGLSSIYKGSYCLAPFKLTPFYYRAQSLSNGKSEKELVKVLFIDHGSTQEISVCDLRLLPKSAYEISAQAIHCYLYGIVPFEDSWSDKCIKRFKDFQNFCIDVVVKSKVSSYGVQLVAKGPADFDEDLSVDVAQALCLDHLAKSLNNSQLPDDNQHFESEFSVMCNKADSFLDVSGSYDKNAISNDSGVCITSSYKSSQISEKRNEVFQEISQDYISMVTPKCDKDVLDIQDLILFNNHDNLSNVQNSNNALKSASNSSLCCQLCRNKDFCLHLTVPSSSLLVEENMVEGNMAFVMLSHIVNPHEFYVNMANNIIESLDDLREEMTKTYDSEQNLQRVTINELRENMFCAGRFNADGHWYRVKIIRISPEEKDKDQILGQYIDYGNTSEIQCCDLRPLKIEFSKYPSFAIKCVLAGIKPVNNEKSGNGPPCWDEDAINSFKNLTSFERVCTAQICNEYFSNQNDSYHVLLWDRIDSKDLLINEELAKLKMAEFDYSLKNHTLTNQKVEESQIDSWDPMSEEYYDLDNNYALDDENIEIMTTGYQAKDEDYTCKYFALYGHCPRGENCNYKHLPLLESGVTHDQEEVFCLDTVPISETVNNILVQVSAIISPSHFYVVLPFGCKTVDDIDRLMYKGLPYDKIINSEAKILFRSINKHYSNASFMENTTVSLSCGTIVAAKRKWDNKWHRGRIVDVVDINKPYKVFFVDSGDTEWVPRNFIQTILPQFLHTPFQAVQCSLYGIEPFGSKEKSSWNSETLNYFKNIVDGQVLLAKIVQRFGLTFQVSLRKTLQNDHSDVAALLVSSEFAQYQTPKKINLSKRQSVYVPG